MTQDKTTLQKLLFIYACALLLPLMVYSQVADSIRLPEIVIVEDPFIQLSESAATRIGRINIENQNGESFSDVLGKKTPLFMRNQGPGLLSTVSFNGFSPSQIRLEWNGLELNHPMLGLLDFSILPSSFIDIADFSPSLVPSGSGVMAMGGVISLFSNSISRQFSITQQLSSLQNYQLQAVAPLGERQSLRLSIQQSQNNFEYTDPVFGTKQTRKYNGLDSYGAYYQTINEIAKISLHSTVWLQNTHREVPGPVGVVSFPATQTDTWFRMSNHVLVKQGESPWKLQHNLAVEKLDFLDSSLVRFGSDPLSWSNTFRNQIRSVNRLWFAPSFWSDLTLDRTDNWVQTNNYEKITYRGVSKAIVHSIWTVSDRVQVSSSLQVEHYSDFGWALSPSLGVSYSFGRSGWFLFSTASRSFAPPSFNDLYWPGQGNPDLQPQSAIKLETGYRFTKTWNSFSLSHDSYVLVANTYNGIQWAPENGIWKPLNIQQSRHTAFNSHVQLSWSYNSFKLESGGDLNLVRAITVTPNSPDNGKQLMYVPEAQAKLFSAMQFKMIAVQGYLQRVGVRYISTSNTQWLQPYTVADINVNVTMHVSTWKIQTGLSVQNITNETFEVMRFYPMPPRVYQLTLTITPKSTNS